MTNDQANELLVLMADQIEAIDRLNQTVDRCFTQLTEVMLTSFAYLEDKMNDKLDKVCDLKTEARTTNRRLQATFDQAGHLTEENSEQETWLPTLKPTSADMLQRIANLETQLRRAS